VTHGKKEGTMFCKNCGKQVDANAEFCGNCGTRVGEAVSQPAGQPAPAAPPVSAGGKKKGVALVLAIFFSFFTWLYTFKRDSKKFFIGLGAWILVIILGFVGVGAFLGILMFAIWIWGIADVARKNDEWYRSY
jgi:hypothetical protein